MKQFWVIAYDIVSNRRRSKISKLMEQYGVRVNYSVFECYIRPDDLAALRDKAAEIIKKKEDSVLFYHLCGSCLGKLERMGNSGGGIPMVTFV